MQARLGALWGFLNKGAGVGRATWLLFAALVFGVPFVLHYHYILNLFYHIGAGFGDSGVFAGVTWRNGWHFTTPVAYALDGDKPISFYSIHFTPILHFLSAISHIIPTHKPEFYGVYTAAVYALISVALYLAFTVCCKPKNPLQLAFYSALCIGFAFNSAIIKGMWYVHVEYGIVMSILFFVLAYVLEYKRVALALFVLTALQREDGGIHLAMVMGAIAACKWWQTRTLSSVRTELNYVAMGLLVGALAWGFTFAIREFDGGRSQSNWELMYSGRPAFAHLSWQLLSERLGYIFQERIYIWLALYVAAVAVYWTRNIYYLAGVLACVPWFMLNLISVQRMTGHFDAYYPFPFVIALGWPLFAVLLKHGLSATGQQVRQGVIVQLLLVIVGLVMWNSTLSRPEFGPIWGQYGDYSLMEGARHRAKVQRFVDLLESGEGQLGDVRADDGISSLIDGTYQGYLVPHFGSRKKPADTFIYMNRNVKRLGEPYLGFVQRTGLTKNYCMPQTTVCMLTNRKPEQLGAFFEMLEPAEIDPRIFDVRVKRGKREIVIKR